MFYQCPNMGCDFRLDLLCASQITIVHRSHAHRLMAIRLRDSASLTCNACDTKHDPSPSPSESESATLSYLCNLCGFWIHPDCASLPNPILHYQHHDHCLFLTYNLPTAADAKCVICNGVPKRTSGVYFCLHCPDYLVHIRCALTRPNIFKPGTSPLTYFCCSSCSIELHPYEWQCLSEMPKLPILAVCRCQMHTPVWFPISERMLLLIFKIICTRIH